MSCLHFVSYGDMLTRRRHAQPVEIRHIFVSPALALTPCYRVVRLNHLRLLAHVPGAFPASYPQVSSLLWRNSPAVFGQTAGIDPNSRRGRDRSPDTNVARRRARSAVR